MTKVVPIHVLRPEPPALALPPGQPPIDALGRSFSDLRISVTDRCNFRCTYCMPKSVFNRGFKFMPHDALLSFEEIERVARLFVARGVKKIRLTGGEPLLRRGIESLIERLARLPEVEITLTTNGSRLAEKARALKAAGLHRVTVSLDALDEATFRRMAGVEVSVNEVLRGIDAAAAAGLAPLKINMVVKRGLNAHAILPMARHFRHSGHTLRFIEYMDVGTSNGWVLDDVIASREIVARIHEEYPVEPVNPRHFSEVAKRWRYADGGGEIGVISSVTQAFCASCTRVRISPEGRLYTCLFAQQGHDLRRLLRGGADDARLDAAIAGIWRQRDDRYSEMRTAATAREARIEMHYIGG